MTQYKACRKSNPSKLRYNAYIGMGRIANNKLKWYWEE